MRKSAIQDKRALHRAKKRLMRENKSYLSNGSRWESKKSFYIPIATVVENLSSIKRQKRRKDNTIILPPTFSILEDPETALLKIQQIALRIGSGDCKEVKLDYKKCKRYSLGSEVLLGVLGKTVQFQKKVRGGGFTSVNGIYPKNTVHKEIVRDVGIVKELEADEEHRNAVDRSRQFIFSKERSSESRGSAQAMDDKNAAAEAFVDYINNCLRSSGGEKELTEKAYRLLTSCVGELLDNAERHAYKVGQGKWYIRAHVNFAHAQPACEIVIFNFGNTVYETFQGLQEDHFSYTKQVKPYVDRHLDCDGMSTEALTLVAALQQRVSCKNTDARKTSGTGTLELLDFFQHLTVALSQIAKHGESLVKPEMVMLSGKAWLKFDGTYHQRFQGDNSLQPVNFFDMDDDRRIIYPFNNHPSGLEVPPDSNYVKTIKDGFFPGVMVNIRFSLDIETSQAS